MAVCVTGASGFIASWLVKLLLERRYNVRGTVRSLEDPSKTQHLRELPGAYDRLKLVEADLLADDGSFDGAFQGCDAVFHTASPVILSDLTIDPELELIQPAVKGTLTVLGACLKQKVRKVIVTSSIATIAFRQDRPEFIDESCYSDIEFCKENKMWYMVSKILAEQHAWDFAKEHGIDMVTIHPSMVIGPLLQPTLNASSEIVLRFIDGSIETYLDFALGWVAVRDVALAHIAAYQDPNSSGRYLCEERCLHFREFTRAVAKLYPQFPVPTKCVVDSLVAVPYKASRTKLEKLGLEFQPLEEMIRDCIESLVAHKYVSVSGETTSSNRVLQLL